MSSEAELIKLNRDRMHPFSCPFVVTGGTGECMHCYELFPGWGDFFLDKDCRRTYYGYAGRVDRLSCPCNSLGEDYVASVVNKLITEED